MSTVVKIMVGGHEHVRERESLFRLKNFMKKKREFMISSQFPYICLMFFVFLGRIVRDRQDDSDNNFRIL